MRPVEGETAGYMADRPIGRPTADKTTYRADRCLSALQGPTSTYVADRPRWHLAPRTALTWPTLVGSSRADRYLSAVQELITVQSALQVRADWHLFLQFFSFVIYLCD